MKKIVIPTLVLLSLSVNAGMFDDNTDMKKKYDFDTTTTAENIRMAKELQRFQDGLVSEEEIVTYLEARENSEVVPFSKDIKVDSELLRDVDMKAREEKGWFSSLLPSWLGGSDVEEVVTEETPTATQEVVTEETPTTTQEVVTEETPTTTQEVVTEENPEQGAE